MTIADGQIVTGDDLATLVDPPAAVLRKSSAQEILASTDTSVEWDVAELDTHGGWDSGEPTRYTCQVDGWYEVAGHIMWEPYVADRRLSWLWLNGVSVLGSREVIWPATSDTALSVARAPLLRMETGDYVEVRVRQATATPLDVQSGTNQAASALYVHYRRPL
ncbi:hypothetical protein EDC02_6348 [Micromonospora sp. Llam0]|uniref:hypothetical protein n=1 Tax=Micromonospora sp. Llam0 TaxID=2485143 RepID=UPI000F492881|nr:hypothetical protein [Micromonospora sp. Llam0]ROO51470.1 hypothetical protein EDC02_6348 [Micromonospora sp. Llam0]